MSTLETLRKRSRPETAITLTLAAVVAMAMGLASSTWSVYGHTWDEPEHIAAGLELLDRGIYEYDIQHPPVARLLMAIGPYLAGARSPGTVTTGSKPISPSNA